MNDHATLRDWLDGHQPAWRSNDAGQIRARFTGYSTPEPAGQEGVG